MRTAIYNVLNDDSALGAILTGDIHTGTQITRQSAPTAFDSNKELLPCALLKFANDTAIGPYETSSALDFNVLVYQRDGVASIDLARARIYALLHRQSVVPSAGGTCWQIRSVGEVLDAWDDVLDASLIVMRFRAVWLRP
jgi:hypothetical protein